MFIGHADNVSMLGPMPMYYEGFVRDLNSTEPYAFAERLSITRTHRVFPFVGKSGALPFAALTRGVEFQMAMVSEGSLVPNITLPDFLASASTLMAWGHFDGSVYARLILYEPNQSIAKTVKVTEPTTGVMAWGTLENLTFQKPLQLIVTIPLATGSRLAVLFTDGTAAVFDWNGSGSPVKRSDLPGSGYDGLLPIGIDSLFTHRGGVCERWNTASTAATLTPAWSGTMPALRSSSRVSNVIFASSEPFVAVNAAPLNLVHVLDWTLAATGSDSSWTVTGLSQGAGGLGSATNVPCLPSPGAPFALVNQYRPNVSLSLLESSVGPPLADVIFNPPPGILPALDANPGPGLPPETCVIQIAPTRLGDTIRFRILPNGVWLTYDPVKPPAIGGDAILEAYPISPAGSGMGGTRRASYTFAAAADLGIHPGSDSDGDGLPDEWEKTFNATNPFADDDGDGKINLHEFHGHTDPRDGTSIPTSGPLVLAATRTGLPGSEMLRLEWSADHSSAVLESIDDS